jgi:hypothetical protein
MDRVGGYVPKEYPTPGPERKKRPPGNGRRESSRMPGERVVEPMGASLYGPKTRAHVSGFLDIRFFDSGFSESLDGNSFTEKALPRKPVDAGCDDL